MRSAPAISKAGIDQVIARIHVVYSVSICGVNCSISGTWAANTAHMQTPPNVLARIGSLLLKLTAQQQARQVFQRQGPIESDFSFPSGVVLPCETVDAQGQSCYDEAHILVRGRSRK